MTAGDIALIALGVLIAALGLRALWPRPEPRAGPGNNWRQRSGNEVRSDKTDTAEEFGSPYLAAWDVSDD